MEIKDSREQQNPQNQEPPADVIGDQAREQLDRGGDRRIGGGGIVRPIPIPGNQRMNPYGRPAQQRPNQSAALGQPVQGRPAQQMPNQPAVPEQQDRMNPNNQAPPANVIGEQAREQMVGGGGDRRSGDGIVVRPIPILATATTNPYARPAQQRPDQPAAQVQPVQNRMNPSVSSANKIPEQNPQNRAPPANVIGEQAREQLDRDGDRRIDVGGIERPIPIAANQRMNPYGRPAQQRPNQRAALGQPAQGRPAQQRPNQPAVPERGVQDRMRPYRRPAPRRFHQRAALELPLGNYAIHGPLRERLPVIGRNLRTPERQLLQYYGEQERLRVEDEPIDQWYLRMSEAERVLRGRFALRWIEAAQLARQQMPNQPAARVQPAQDRVNLDVLEARRAERRADHAARRARFFQGDVMQGPLREQLPFVGRRLPTPQRDLVQEFGRHRRIERPEESIEEWHLRVSTFERRITQVFAPEIEEERQWRMRVGR